MTVENDGQLQASTFALMSYPTDPFITLELSKSVVRRS